MKQPEMRGEEEMISSRGPGLVFSPLLSEEGNLGTLEKRRKRRLTPS